MNRLFIREDEGGFTTVGTAVALLLVLALTLSATQAYWVGTRSAQIQYVADSAALAADGAVAEFVTYGQVIDAALLSFSLVTIMAFAASAVAAFIPGGEGVAAKLAEAGTKVMQTRNKFARSAQTGINAAQKALPALCAVRAAQVIQANADASGIDYYGLAIATPIEAEEVEFEGLDVLDETMQQIEDHEQSIEEDAATQQHAQEAADAAKEQGWLADCGGSMSMMERAGRLAGMSGASNPYYSSPDTWSWAAALARARTYYQARYDREPGPGAAGTPEEVGQSVARKRFYYYAIQELARCSVETTASGFELPQLNALARNTDQVRTTSLYREAIYPASINANGKTIHAYVGCPGYRAGTPAGSVAVSAVDSGEVGVCDYCHFSVNTLGRVPSASTSINNGFEYYYKALVDASVAYRNAVQDMDESTSRMQQAGNEIKDLISTALESLKGQRYDPQPPGRYGCIAIVFAPQTPGYVQSSLVAGDGHISARVAISGATLAPDESEDQANVIASIGTGLIPSEGIGQGLLKTLFGAWGGLLQAYVNGVDGIKTAFDTTLGAIPLVGTRMSEWASDTFSEALEAGGLEPPDLAVYKPVLVNTSHILARSDSGVASALGQLKDAAGLVGSNQAETIANVIGALPLPGGVTVGSEGVDMVTLVLSELGIGVGSSSLTLDAPPDFLAQYAALIAQTQGQLRGAG